MKQKFINKNIFYDGSQLRPLFAYESFKVTGNSIVSWIGGCNVSLDQMVDLEDKIVLSEIKSDKMLHFIIELFGADLTAAVSLQRLFASQVLQLLKSKLKKSLELIRDGDDIYWIDQRKGKKTKRKLSISIASRSVVSSQIHFAMNITNSGTPVETCALTDFIIDPVQFAKEAMKIFSSEFESIVEATQKVYPL